MSSTLLSWAAGFAIVCAAVAIALCMLRLVRGPESGDRVLALDTMYVSLVALLVALGVAQAVTIHFEAALLIALTGFIGTVAAARYLARGDVID